MKKKLISHSHEPTIMIHAHRQFITAEGQDTVATFTRNVLTCL